MIEPLDYSCQIDHYLLSTDRNKLDIDWIYQALTNTYWATGIPREIVERAIAGSLPFGIYSTEESRQVGIGRIISDFATFAYLSDVFIDPAHRGKGLSQWLVESVQLHPDLKNLRRFALVSTKAHDLYEKCGFSELATPELWMEIYNPHIYLQDGGHAP